MAASSDTLPQHHLVQCYDYQYKLRPHPDQNPRYISPTTGKCRGLKVQAMNGPFTEYRVPVTDHPDAAINLAEQLANSNLLQKNVLEWLWKYILFHWYLIVRTVKRAEYTGHYKSFAHKYWGQFWDARSKMEFSKHRIQVNRPLSADGMPGRISATFPRGEGPLASEPHSGVTPDYGSSNLGLTPQIDITRARWPRKLIMHGPIGVVPATWHSSVDVALMRTARYLAVSYKRDDFPADSQIYGDMIRAVRAACLEWELDGYWIDNECTGAPGAEKNIDVYRIADVFRGAKRTLIMVRGEEGLQSWGGRVWTLPELLLSNDVYIQDTFDSDSRPRETDKRRVANAAYIGLDRETPGMDQVVDHFCGKDIMDRLERLSNLKDAIWKRAINQRLSDSFGYPAERVYALMGFFEHRILPDRIESEMNALARLSMANDTDRIVERMLCMYPNNIEDRACWYSADDKYEANLWDIEPVIQAAGTTEHGALILDGCRAATIRWKDFPRVAFKTKGSFKRTFCLFVSQSALFFFIITAAIFGPLAQSVRGFAAIPIIFAFLIIISPWLFWCGTSGRIVASQPWFIGVEGFMDVKEVVEHLYGNKLDSVLYSPSGSPFARYDTGHKRKGHTGNSQEASKKFLEDPNRPTDQRPYTLVDTLSNTVYHFTARRPPTVCVFGGREGGLGRFVLCSELCKNNELHKEAVLRMPTWISGSMRLCDWLAIGTTGAGACEMTCDS